MNINKHISKWITEQLLGEEAYDETISIKLNYYFQVIIDDLEKFLLLLLIFIYTGNTAMYLLCFIAVSITRTFVGGLHMKSSVMCLFMTFAIYFVSITLGKICILKMLEKTIITLLDVIFIVMFTPIPSPQRPRYSIEKKKRFKRRAVIGVLIVFCISVFLGNYADCIIWILMFQLLEIIVVMLNNKLKGGQGYAEKYSG